MKPPPVRAWCTPLTLLFGLSLIPVALAGACAAADSRPPAPPCPTASPSAASSAPPSVSIRLDQTTRKNRTTGAAPGGSGDAILRALDADGRESWARAWDGIDAFAPDGEGGAFVVASFKRVEFISHIGPDGQEKWVHHAVPTPGSRQQLAASPSSITWLYELQGASQRKTLVAFLRRDGTVTQTWEPAEPCVVVGSDASLTLSDRAGHMRHFQPHGALAWTADAFPRSSDPSTRPDACPVVRSCPNGALIAGAPDGTLTNFDAQGARRWQWGMRGAITTIDAPTQGPLTVRANDFSSLLIDSSCRAPDLSDASVAAMVLTAQTLPLTAPLVFRKELPGPVHSLALTSPGHLVALRDNVVHQWKDHVHSSAPLPQPTTREVFFQGAQAEQGRFEESRATVGPAGKLWIVGLRRTDGEVPLTFRLSALRALEQTQGGWRELGELQRRFWQTRVDHTPVVSTGPGDKVVCGNHVCSQWRAGKWELLSTVSQEPVRSAHATAASVWVVGVDHIASWQAGAWKHHPRGSGGRWTSVWATSDSDVWVGGECAFQDGSPRCALMHFDGASWKSVVSPVGVVHGLWASAQDDVWVVGAEGAARFNGTSWSRVIGVQGACYAVYGSGRNDVWVGAESGLWHATPFPDGDGPSQPTSLPLHRAVQGDLPPARIDPLADDPSWRADPVALPQSTGLRLDHALSVACGPDNTLWLTDEHGAVSYDGKVLRRIYGEDRPPWVIAHGAAAPADHGLGWAIGTDGLMEIGPGAVARSTHQLPGISAIALSSAGSLWAVSSWPARGYPRLLSRIDSHWRYAPSIPEATYVAVSAWGVSDVWVAGGIGKSDNASRVWPEGQGILLHGSATAYTWYSIPAGPLLAVSAIGPTEAWAAGPDGRIVHVRDGLISVQHLAEPTWLRAVGARSPNEVWFAGDDATLLRWNGNALARVPLSGASRAAALTSVATCADGSVWAVGPETWVRVNPVGKRD